MIEPSSVSHHISIQDLSEYTPAVQHSVPEMTAHLLSIVSNQFDNNIHFLTLPSLSTMANLFNCPYLAIYDAMQALREHGYDYNFSSINGNIEIWRCQRK